MRNIAAIVCTMAICGTFTELALAQKRTNVELLKNCEARFGELKEKYQQLVTEKKYWKAAGVLRTCTNVWPTEEMNNMIADAEVKEHLSVIKNPRATKKEKQNAMERLVIDYPEHGKPYEKFLPKPDPLAAAPRVFSGNAAIKNMINYCANLAGLSTDDPRDRISKTQMTVLTNCVDQNRQHLQ
jgi:hypothetical protein